MKHRKKIFFTSDLHIGHEQVLNYSNRPFRDLDHMHKGLIKNYNAIVPEDGICYFLGDIGLCGSQELTNTINQLNGTKILILGNHDKGVNAMYNCGFDAVLYGATMKIAGERVTLSHCPMLGKYREDATGMKGSREGENWHGELNPKREIFTVKEHNHYHIHGHVHSPNSGRSKKIEGKQFDVGVDANNYRPVSISMIESWITRSKGK